MTGAQDLLIWLDVGGQTERVGRLHVGRVRSGERYRFRYDERWLTLGFPIDPGLPLSSYEHYTERLWGCFQDVSPDRWGRLLMHRRQGVDAMPASAYLLGVSDFMRLGALRLSLAEQPERMVAGHQEVPKLVHLHALLSAVGDVERNRQTPAELQMLLYPGSSLGGARPKAVIQDAGALWIAKFPSRTDANRIPLWEKTAMDLASCAGIPVPPMRVLFADTENPVFLIRRFDRHLSPDGAQQRIHFASAMTLLGRQDGDPASWLDLLDAVQQYSAQPRRDAADLWRRMVFGMVISNTDDHLRNHGFLRTASGWMLSPAYDINFDITDAATRRHALSFDARVTTPSAKFALEFTELFGLSAADSIDIIRRIAAAVKEFPMVARQNGLDAEETKRAGQSLRLDILGDLEAFCSNKKQGKETIKRRRGP